LDEALKAQCFAGQNGKMLNRNLLRETVISTSCLDAIDCLI